MKPNVSVLDCTLREAPIENLMWGDLSIHKAIDGLEKSGVQIIEIGFLKNQSHILGSSSFQYVEEIKQYLTPKKNDVLYTALVDYGRYDIENLSVNDGQSIDAIRLCFKHGEQYDAIHYAKEIIKKGYKVCIQHVDTLAYSENEIIRIVEAVNELKPFCYSIVDTFGAMYQKDMLKLAKVVDTKLDKSVKLGFHGHNNLMLADSNVQRFIEEFAYDREVIVDASLYGCGRGAGNAHTELVCQFMNCNYDTQYDINELLDLIDVVIAAAQEKTSWGYSIPYFIAGMHNAHSYNVNHLLKRHNIKSKDLRGIIEKLDNEQKKAYDYALLEKIYVEYFNNPVNDDVAINNLKKEFENKRVLIIAPGKSIVEKRETIVNYIQTNTPIVIGVNNLIEGFDLNYIFYSGPIRYQNLSYQKYQGAGSPKIIVTSNIKTEASNNEIVIDYYSLLRFGCVNIDSSAILLLRLLIKCEVRDVTVAGMDGYSLSGQSFYSKELETNLDDADKIDHTNDNLKMIKDIKRECPEFNMHFITESIYSKALEEGKNV